MDRKLRHKRIRSKIKGTATRPRLSIYRSLKGLWIQLIDDDKGHTMLSVNHKQIKESKIKVDQAKQLGIAVAKAALTKKITQIVFDRSGYQYKGRVKALAEGAREGGLKF